MLGLDRYSFGGEPVKDLLFAFSEKFESFDDTSNAENALSFIKSEIDISDAAFLVTNLPTNAGIGTYALSTYSDDWHKHYMARSYLDIDPVVQNALTRITPFDWDVPDPTPELATFFGEAREFGISNTGFSVPIRGIRGDIGVFSVSSDLSTQDWRLYSREHQSDLMLLAYYFYMASVDMEHPENRSVSLSPREYDVLSWISRGKSAHTVAAILGLSQKTIELYLSNVRVKLRAANTTHAVAKAVKWGMIDPID